MSKSFSVNLNNNEIIEACSNLGILQEDFGKAIKSLMLNKENSGYYPKQLFAQKLEQVNKEKNMTMQDRSKEKSLKELENILGIKGRNTDKKLKAAGLYYKKNFEDYVSDFVMWWDGDKGKAFEFILKLHNLTWYEYCAIEYSERKTLGTLEGGSF
jgi:hypothetical protein|tara:strand:- start:239 stop:706 length:468 start_codon:yes stop_codon:yes gene_type:complete